MPRPSLLERDPKLSERICAHVRKGMSHTNAARKEQVNVATMDGWKNLGIKDLEAGEDTLYSRFYKDIQQAEADSLGELEALMKNLAAGQVQTVEETTHTDADGQVSKTRKVTNKADGRAASWLLERRMKQVYGPKQEIKHEGEVGGKVIILDPQKEEKDGSDN